MERPKGLACTFKETEEPKGSILPFCHFEKSVPKDATNQHMNCTNREAKGQSLPQKKTLGPPWPLHWQGGPQTKRSRRHFCQRNWRRSGTATVAELKVVQYVAGLP